jgi:hypothetical protein
MLDFGLNDMLLPFFLVSVLELKLQISLTTGMRDLWAGQAQLENIQGQKLPYGTPNHAWLSLDLLEVLCCLAEMGHFGSVRALLDLPLKHCPELLVLGLAQIKTEWNTIQSEIVPILLPTFFANNTTNSVLHQLWTLNPEMVTRTMVEMHASDPSYISRILDVCQELKAMNTVLETTPFSVSIELAAIASRRDFLNLEKWLQDNLTIHRDSFFQVGVSLLIPGVRYEHMSLFSSLFIPSGVAIKLCSCRSLTVLCSFVWGLQVDNNSGCKPIFSSHQTCHEKF